MSTTALTVSLPTSTLYVSGTVNGVETVWTNTSGQQWETMAERAEDEVYQVALTIIDDAGKVSESSFTLYYGLHLITDRTLADVDSVQKLAEAIKNGVATAEQVQEYLSVHQKGAYTYEDLNRVEEAVLYVAKRLREFGHLPYLPVTQFWRVEDKINEDDFSRYFGNVAMLRNAITVWGSTPEAPNSAVGFDYSKANALEQILVDIDQILTHISRAWFYSGDLYSAEV